MYQYLYERSRKFNNVPIVLLQMAHQLLFITAENSRALSSAIKWYVFSFAMFQRAVIYREEPGTSHTNTQLSNCLMFCAHSTRQREVGPHTVPAASRRLSLIPR